MKGAGGGVALLTCGRVAGWPCLPGCASVALLGVACADHFDLAYYNAKQWRKWDCRLSHNARLEPHPSLFSDFFSDSSFFGPIIVSSRSSNSGPRTPVATALPWRSTSTVSGMPITP